MEGVTPEYQAKLDELYRVDRTSYEILKVLSKDDKLMKRVHELHWLIISPLDLRDFVTRVVSTIQNMCGDLTFIEFGEKLRYISKCVYQTWLDSIKHDAKEHPIELIMEIGLELWTVYSGISGKLSTANK